MKRVSTWLALTSSLLSGTGNLLAQQRPSRGTLEVVAALVAEELAVRPVPLLELLLVRREQATPMDTLRVRTGLDGRVSVEVETGSYDIRSAAPTRLGGRSYSWGITLTVPAGRTTRLELTNANAAVDSTQIMAPPLRQLAPEILVYERIRNAVFKVQAGAGHGSSFLIDTMGGLIVTNDHVLGGALPVEVSIILDSSTRVPAQVVVRDHDADLAILRIHQRFTAGLPRLRPAGPDTSGAVAVPGERIIAVGFPLSQGSTVTSGIVSGVRQGAIVSDVNINPGNSGGPVLNMAGDVIGVATFAESSDQGGPGVAGAVAVQRLGPLLARAQLALTELPAVAERPLPTAPPHGYPIALLSTSDTATHGSYRRVSEIRAGNFVLSLATPLSQLVAYKRFEDEVSRDRRAREARAGLSPEQRYSSFAPLRDWMEFVGDLTTPVTTVDVSPRVGETAGSLWGNLLSAFAAGASRTPYVQGRRTMEFKGDVHWVRFYRNGALLDPIKGGRVPQRVYVNNAWVLMRDLAYRGYYVLGPELFAPDSTGAPPSIVLVVRDLKHLSDPNIFELPAEVVARIWNDFLPYRQAVDSTLPSYQADPRRFASRELGFCDTRNCWIGDSNDSTLAGLRLAPGDDTASVYVAAVSRTSPAWRAGIRSDDMIVSVNGRRGLSLMAIEQLLANPITDSLRITVRGWRGGPRETTLLRHRR